ncbi:MAG TPA: hypothetical protein VIK91_16570, partial [Nannocystis sp.]
MRRAAPLVLVVAASASLLAACAQLAALLGAGSQPAAGASEDPQAEAARRPQEEQRRAAEAAEAARREQALLAEIERLRADLSAGTGDRSALAIAFAERARQLAAAPATTDVDRAALTREAAGHLDAALQQAPSFDLLRALFALPREPEVDAACLRACSRLRPQVAPEQLIGFVGDCLQRAGGDPARLTWPGAAADLAAYDRYRAEELRRAQEAEARRIAEEQERAREQAARAALAERYVAAAVFAAGRCNFGNCARDGW